MLLREGDRIIYKPTRYISEKHITVESGVVVIVDTITPEILTQRMQRNYSIGFARYIAYNGGMSTICDVVEAGSVTGKKTPLLVKTANDDQFACSGKIYPKKG